MALISFTPGQRWISNTESELGLGMVAEASNRRVEIAFPAAGEKRIYATDNAPLSRVQYQVGEQVRSDADVTMTIREIIEANGCLIYGGVDSAGESVVIPEQHLNSFVQFSQPQDRLFAGQIDRNQAFELRCETLEHAHIQQQSPVVGLLGPRVQLLPHQLYIAAEAASRFAPRVLLADEVGLGKTIEAGLILHQLLMTGRAHRVLIVVPDSLLHQWLVEMLRRFNLRFTIIDEGTIEAADPEENVFESGQLILCTMPFLVDHNKQHGQAVAADWDLLIVDEAHHLEWTESSASPAYQAIEVLASKATGLLLLTATPEQLGVEGHFARLRLLDPDRYFDLQTFLDEEQKHQPVNGLVKQLMAEDVFERFAQNRDLAGQLQSYLGDEVVTPLVALADDEDLEGFTPALDAVIRSLLDRHGTGRVLFRNTRASVSGFPERQLNQYPLTAPDKYIQHIAEAPVERLLAPELLLDEAWITEDPRVSWLSEWMSQHNDEKVLVICSQADTAIALEEHLQVRVGIHSAVFHEGLSLVGRDRAAAYFADKEDGAQVLICSEIGSEGRNFQFSHHLVLFDLPLSPDLLEQRIGRLDRIGQLNTVEIHVPYYEKSAQAVMLAWYHSGVNAFERTCPAGQALFAEFEDDLMACCRSADDEDALDSLVQRTSARTAEMILTLQQGRDRLLELNSFDERRADEIAGDLVDQQRRQELDAYMERVFDLFGVDQEHHSTNSLVLQPSDHMLEHSFPSLPEDGTTVTYQRELALAREDMQFLTWEHPMVEGAMDQILSGDFGNTAFCILKLRRFKPGTILLECLFTMTCAAPRDLQLQRYLPLTPRRILVDNKLRDLSEILSASRLAQLAQKAPKRTAQDLVRYTRPQITAMIKTAEALAEAQKATTIETAVEAMLETQGTESERLKALAAVNQNIRQEEIDYLDDSTTQMKGYLEGAQISLNAIRVAMVSE